MAEEITAEGLIKALQDIRPFIAAGLASRINYVRHHKDEIAFQDTEDSAEPTGRPGLMDWLKGKKPESDVARERRKSVQEFQRRATPPSEQEEREERELQRRQKARRDDENVRKNIITPGLNIAEDKYSKVFTPLEWLAFSYLKKYAESNDYTAAHSASIRDQCSSFFPCPPLIDEDLHDQALLERLREAIKELVDEEKDARPYIRKVYDEVKPAKNSGTALKAFQEAASEEYNRRSPPSKPQPSKQDPAEHAADEDMGFDIAKTTTPNAAGLHIDTSSPVKKPSSKKKSKVPGIIAGAGLAALTGVGIYGAKKMLEKPPPSENEPRASAKADNIPPPVPRKRREQPVDTPDQDRLSETPDVAPAAEAPGNPADEKKPAGAGAPEKPAGEMPKAEPEKPQTDGEFDAKVQAAALQTRAAHLREMLGKTDDELVEHMKKNYIPEIKRRSRDVPDLPEPPKKKDRHQKNKSPMVSLLLPKEVVINNDGEALGVDTMDEAKLRTAQAAWFINAPELQAIIIPQHGGSFGLEATDSGKFRLLDAGGQHMVDKAGHEIEVNPAIPLVIAKNVYEKGKELDIPLPPIGGVHQVNTGIALKTFYPGAVHFIDMDIDISNMSPLSVDIPKTLHAKERFINPNIKSGAVNYTRWKVAGDCGLLETCEQAIAPVIGVQQIDPKGLYRLSDEGCLGVGAFTQFSPEAWGYLGIMFEDINSPQSNSLKITVRQGEYKEVVNAIAKPRGDNPLGPMTESLIYLKAHPDECTRSPKLMEGMVESTRGAWTRGRYVQIDQNKIDDTGTGCRSVANFMDPRYTNRNSLIYTNADPSGLNVHPGVAGAIGDGKRVVAPMYGGDELSEQNFSANMLQLSQAVERVNNQLGVKDKFAGQPPVGIVPPCLDPVLPFEVSLEVNLKEKVQERRNKRNNQRDR